jgi:hypothetical protein
VFSTGQLCPGLPRVLYDALIRLGYDGDAPVYRCRLSRAHGMDQYKVSVMIPFDPMELMSGSIISSEPVTGIEMMAHIILTSLCEECLMRYCSTAYHASPDSESRKPHKEAEP